MPRDQAPSAFTDILARLCASTGARAAVLVDRDGETVDYHSTELEGYDARVLGAEWRLVLDTFQRSTAPLCAATGLILVRARQSSFGIAALPAGYGLVVLLRRHRLWVSERALAVAIREIGVESGLVRPSARSERWVRVRVVTVAGEPHRPANLWHEQTWQKVIILGRYQQLDFSGRSLGYRVRLETGLEFTLVREPLGAWYAERLD